MGQIPAFPKIFALGTKYISSIFNEDVEVTEKIDGSQFGFGKIDGVLFCRSRGQMINTYDPNKMFTAGVAYIKSIEHLIPDNIVFHGEYLNKPKHNTLQYDRIPQNFIMMFAASFPDGTFIDSIDWAMRLGFEHVPVLYRGMVNNMEELKVLMDKESVLGGNAEGLVVKNYNRSHMIGERVIPIMVGKFVSDKFKEIHDKDWKKENSDKGRWDTFVSQFRTEARWEKAVQHLKEKGELENDPKDIGKLMRELNQDVEEECAEMVKEYLWQQNKRRIMKVAGLGMPQWYKEKLAKESFSERTDAQED